MDLADVNFIPVLVAAVIQYLFGWLWYSPMLFGQAWMSGCGLRKEDCNGCSWHHWVGAFAVSFVTAWVFAALLNRFVISDWQSGAQLGFFIWLGFSLTQSFSGYLWSKQNFTVFLINTVFMLISLLFFGAFLSSWK